MQSDEPYETVHIESEATWQQGYVKPWPVAVKEEMERKEKKRKEIEKLKRRSKMRNWKEKKGKKSMKKNQRIGSIRGNLPKNKINQKLRKYLKLSLCTRNFIISLKLNKRNQPLRK